MNNEPQTVLVTVTGFYPVYDKIWWRAMVRVRITDDGETTGFNYCEYTGPLDPFQFVYHYKLPDKYLAEVEDAIQIAVEKARRELRNAFMAMEDFGA
jgi:hypothetical protein